MEFVSASSDSVSRSILDTLAVSEDQGWQLFCNLKWPERDEVTFAVLNELSCPSGLSKAGEIFLARYRQQMEPYIREDFYDIVANRIPEFADKYRIDGEVDVPLLKVDCLDDLSDHCQRLEKLGHSRYDTVRTVYPPGEVKRFDDADPRKPLVTQVNMVAVANRHLKSLPESDPAAGIGIGIGTGAANALQWVYHSPHLQAFIAGVMGFTCCYPYESDLGLAVNIMRPAGEVQPNAKPAQTALSLRLYR